MKQVKEGVIRKLSKPAVAKEPLTPEIIQKIVQAYGTGTNLLDLRFVTMCLLGYAGFLRFDELVNIRRSDIFIQEMQIKLYISKGKTAQLKSGSWVVIAKTNKETCPVKYLQMYLSVFNIHENSDEFIFRKASYIKN